VHQVRTQIDPKPAENEVHTISVN